MAALCTGLVALTLSSCCSPMDDTLGEGTAVSPGSVGLNLTVSTRASSVGGTGVYETGLASENAIDIADDDYRIYVFDAREGEGKYIGRFEPSMTVVLDEVDFTRYQVFGQVDAGDEEVLKLDDMLSAQSDFKIVFVANWGTYPTLTKEESTIKDLCDNDFSTFDAFKFEPSSADYDETYLYTDKNIPMYGVKHYTGKEFVAGEALWVEPINVLRAVAKIEVVLEEDDPNTTFESVTLHNYNKEGYCAPAVYDHTAYEGSDNASEWTVTELHLIDNGDVGNEFPFKKTKEYGGVGEYETWTAYVPEYDNTSDPDNASYIVVQLSVNGVVQDTHTIYFTDYELGQSVEDEPFDLHRNCLYRFYVSTSMWIRLESSDWENTFDNEFTFEDE